MRCGHGAGLKFRLVRCFYVTGTLEKSCLLRLNRSLERLGTYTPNTTVSPLLFEEDPLRVAASINKGNE